MLNYGSLKVHDDNSVSVKVNYLKPAYEAQPGAGGASFFTAE